MATSTQPSTTASSDEMAQLIADSRAAAAVLSETIKQENEVFLSFCQGLISQTLNAANEMNKMILNVAKEGASAKADGAKKKASDAVSSAAKSAKKATENGKDSVTRSVQNNALNLDKDVSTLAGGFVHSMLTTMQNSVNAQQQMFVTAQAATTQTIVTILSLDVADVSVAAKNILNSK